MSSIFLANEYGVTVFANDLWVSATNNYLHFRDKGLEDRIIPIYAEAHALPYADEYFDAIISVDSYHYYGTDALYLDYISKFLKPNGQIGIVFPSLTEDFEDTGVPEAMLPYWEWSMYSFHTPKWWKRLWNFSQSIEVEVSDFLQDGYDIWLYWEKTLSSSGLIKRKSDIKLLEADKEKYLTLGRIIGRKKALPKKVR